MTASSLAVVRRAVRRELRRQLPLLVTPIAEATARLLLTWRPNTDAISSMGTARPALLDRQAAAAHLGLSVASFTRHVRPHVVAVQTGGHPRYRREDLDAWAAQRTGRGPLLAQLAGGVRR